MWMDGRGGDDGVGVGRTTAFIQSFLSPSTQSVAPSLTRRIRTRRNKGTASSDCRGLNERSGVAGDDDDGAAAAAAAAKAEEGGGDCNVNVSTSMSARKPPTPVVVAAACAIINGFVS